MKKILFAAFALAGCGAHIQQPPPEPIVRTVEVRVPVPVRCQALEELGPEPAYPDTPEAIHQADNLFTRVSLLLQGRALRIARQAQYAAAVRSCAS